MLAGPHPPSLFQAGLPCARVARLPAPPESGWARVERSNSATHRARWTGAARLQAHPVPWLAGGRDAAPTQSALFENARKLSIKVDRRGLGPHWPRTSCGRAAGGPAGDPRLRQGSPPRRRAEERLEPFPGAGSRRNTWLRYRLSSGRGPRKEQRARWLQVRRLSCRRLHRPSVAAALARFLLLFPVECAPAPTFDAPVRVLTVEGPTRAVGLFVPVYTVLAFARGMPKAPILYATAAGLVLVRTVATRWRLNARACEGARQSSTRMPAGTRRVHTRFACQPHAHMHAHGHVRMQTTRPKQQEGLNFSRRLMRKARRCTGLLEQCTGRGLWSQDFCSISGLVCIAHTDTHAHTHTHTHTHTDAGRVVCLILLVVRAGQRRHQRDYDPPHGPPLPGLCLCVCWRHLCFYTLSV